MRRGVCQGDGGDEDDDEDDSEEDVEGFLIGTLVHRFPAAAETLRSFRVCNCVTGRWRAAVGVFVSFV